MKFVLAKCECVSDYKSVLRLCLCRKSPNIKGPRGPEFGKESDTGGGVATKVRDPELKKKRKLRREDETEKEKEWRVLLHNDNVHTFDYVTQTITDVVKTISRKKAFRITMQAHSSGVSTVTVTWKVSGCQPLSHTTQTSTKSSVFRTKLSWFNAGLATTSGRPFNLLVPAHSVAPRFPLFFQPSLRFVSSSMTSPTNSAISFGLTGACGRLL